MASKAIAALGQDLDSMSADEKAILEAYRRTPANSPVSQKWLVDNDTYYQYHVDKAVTHQIDMKVARRVQPGLMSVCSGYRFGDGQLGERA